MNVETMQTALNQLGFKLRIDGWRGEKTWEAIRALLGRNINRLQPGILPNEQRQLIAAEQLIYWSRGLYPGDAIDGLVGPLTQQARVDYAAVLATGKPDYWRDEPMPTADIPIPPIWPLQKDVERFFGEKGKNQASLALPFPMRLAWDTDTIVRRFSIHEKVHDSALRVLTRVLSQYGEGQIKRLGLDLFAGCLNVRKMKGGSAWSMHSWGIAIDFDSANNQLAWNHKRARFAAPEYKAFWKLWEEEGWVSLGRARDFDWMHVQAARL